MLQTTLRVNMDCLCANYRHIAAPVHSYMQSRPTNLAIAQALSVYSADSVSQIPKTHSPNRRPQPPLYPSPMPSDRRNCGTFSANVRPASSSQITCQSTSLQQRKRCCGPRGTVCLCGTATSALASRRPSSNLHPHASVRALKALKVGHQYHPLAPHSRLCPLCQIGLTRTVRRPAMLRKMSSTPPTIFHQVRVDRRAVVPCDCFRQYRLATSPILCRSLQALARYRTCLRTA